jgi:hypothetical protein
VRFFAAPAEAARAVFEKRLMKEKQMSFILTRRLLRSTGPGEAPGTSRFTARLPPKHTHSFRVYEVSQRGTSHADIIA